MGKKIFSVDVESNGLYGKPFCIAAIVEQDGVEIDRFIGRCHIKETVESWVKENVFPAISDIPIEFFQDTDLLIAFGKFYNKYRDGATVIAHIPFPVEAYMFRLLYNGGNVSTFDNPYPLIDVGSMLHAIGEDATSTEGYVYNNSLPTPCGSQHNPLYDCQIALLVYKHIISGKCTNTI